MTINVKCPNQACRFVVGSVSVGDPDGYREDDLLALVGPRLAKNPSQPARCPSCKEVFWDPSSLWRPREDY